jgi:hypothetical protein
VRFATRGLWLAVLAAAVLVGFRSAVWLLWPQSYFDSDQAIYGLMAKHISEGRAFPLFMYGQNYTLAIDAWLAAPVFLLTGPSVLALKLPLFALNIIIAALLVWLLRRDTGLSWASALMASAFFTAAPPLAASRLLEASGGNAALLFFTPLLWVLRRRPVLLGVVAGVSFANREFTWYALLALLLIEWWEGTPLTRRRLGEWARVAVIAVAVAGSLNVVARQGAVLGPGTAGTGFRALQIRKPAAFACFDTAALASNADWTLRGNLAALFGWEPEVASAYGVASALEIGNAWALWPLLALVGLFVTALIVRLTHAPPPDRTAPTAPFFAAYLLVVGVESVVGYATLACDIEQPMLIRYTLLALFGAVGASAWLLQRTQPRVIRVTAIAGILLWTSVSLWDSGALFDEYVRRTPADAPAELIAHLDARGTKFGHASYWTAYVVDFRSSERLVIAADRYARITEYQRLVSAQPDADVARIGTPPCEARAVAVAGWCVGAASR